RPGAALSAPGEHAARFAAVAAPLLDEAFLAGAEFAREVVPGAAVAEPAAGPEAGSLAEGLTSALRARIEAALAEAGPDEAAAAESVGAAYRSWKGERTESLAMDHVVAAFQEGVLAAVPPGTPLRWVVDDDGPCPDCDDNELAGATPAGEGFPTGQPHPPAHPGCRCVLAPAPA
ncbi:MAG TPA: hypothetical protein VFH70_07075, partial [Acidimicrobiales bacterium]|nr:hypothetical protein [Acidimicrobiales bacterium]